MAERDRDHELAWELLYRLWTKGEVAPDSAAAELAAVLRAVRAEERERCAAVCERVASHDGDEPMFRRGAEDCAEEIRRG